MRRKTLSGIMFSLLLVGILSIQLNILPVKAQPLELYYDDEEADQGDASIANRTLGWGVKFEHPAPGIAYRIGSVKFYIFCGSGPYLRLFVYLCQSTSIYEKVYENIVDTLTLGWNVIDLTSHDIVAYEDFIVGFNWVLDYDPYLGVDTDTESHSGWFETYSTTTFNRYSGFFNYMIRAYVIPVHTLTIFSSPTGVTFTVDGVSRITPWSGTYSVGSSVSLVMPETYVGYFWHHWLEDGDTNRIKTVIMDTNVTLTGVYAAKPVGGKATPINIPMNKPETPTLWIWLSTIILSLAVTVVYVKKRKRHTETSS